MDLQLIYCKGDILLTQEGNIPQSVPEGICLNPWNRITSIDHQEDRCHVIRLDAPPNHLEGYRMTPLRQSYRLLGLKDYQLASKGAELIYFDQNSRFCGCCGAPMNWSTDISKKCTICKKELWPSLAPAIIVRIERNESILMVHARNFRDRHFGLVAGFVETGETLEQCVRREVLEETGLTIKDIQYFGSQSWPYPSGLMVGFTAKYESGELHIQNEELSSAGWFTIDKLPLLPDSCSIARQLIDDWMASQMK
ncbi:MAG: NAD(+) diphosphatase [Bacteroidaceae bacterium]